MIILGPKCISPFLKLVTGWQSGYEHKCIPCQRSRHAWPDPLAPVFRTLRFWIVQDYGLLLPLPTGTYTAPPSGGKVSIPPLPHAQRNPLPRLLSAQQPCSTIASLSPGPQSFVGSEPITRSQALVGSPSFWGGSAVTKRQSFAHFVDTTSL